MPLLHLNNAPSANKLYMHEFRAPSAWCIQPHASTNLLALGGCSGPLLRPNTRPSV